MVKILGNFGLIPSSNPESEELLAFHTLYPKLYSFINFFIYLMYNITIKFRCELTHILN